MPKRRRRPVLRALLGAALLLAVLAVAGVVTATLLIDPNGFKPEIEAAVARATGGTLDLHGPIRLGLGLPPRLVADDIVFAGGHEEAEARVARLAARIALLPLLTGEVDIVRLDLMQPAVILKPGTATPPAAVPPAQAAVAHTSAGQPHGGQMRLAVGAVHVEDGRLTWHGTTFGLPRLDAVAAAPGASLVLTGDVVSAGRRLTLSGEIGPVGSLLDRSATAPWPVELVLQGEGARVAVRGTVAEPLRRAGYAVQLDAAATDLGAFAPLLPVALPALHDISLSARLVDMGQRQPEVSAVTVHVGGLDLNRVMPGLVVMRADVTAPDLHQPVQADVQATLHGTRLHVQGTAGPLAGPLGATLPVALTVEVPAALQLRAVLDLTLGARPAVRGSLAVQRLNLDALLAAWPVRPAPKPEAAPAAAPSPAPPARLFPDRPIDLTRLRAIDADLSLSVAALQTDGVIYSDVSGHLALQGGRLALDPFAGESPGGRLDGRLAVDAMQAVPPMALVLHGPTLALAPFAAALGRPGTLDGSATVDADLKAAGASPHALAATLSGHLALSATDADIDNALLASALSGVLRAARLPESLLGGAGRTRLHCLDIRLDARDGTVTVARLLADTPRLALQGGGSADLGPETLNLHLRPLLRVGPGVVVPVRVGGTLLDPKPAPDAGAAARAALGGAPPDETCGPAAQGEAPPAGSAKPPKPIDILRGLLSH